MLEEKVEYADYRVKCEGRMENGESVRFYITTSRKLIKGECFDVEVNGKTEKVTLCYYKYQRLNESEHKYPDYIEDVEFPDNIRRCKKTDIIER